jgi:hypothetical protein
MEGVSSLMISALVRSGVHSFVCGHVLGWLDKGDVFAECLKLFSARHQMPAGLWVIHEGDGFVKIWSPVGSSIICRSVISWLFICATLYNSQMTKV